MSPTNWAEFVDETDYERLALCHVVGMHVETSPGSRPPARAPLRHDHWRERLVALATEHHVPGASLGLMRLEPEASPEVVTCTHGVLNLATGVSTTPDSLFQIGSLTKVWTATLVMQLVEEGRLHLDEPVQAVLAELVLRDEEATRAVTTRQLLNHTSGIDGDLFIDTGRGDDALRRYVDRLVDMGQLHRPGRGWSYCNVGYSIAGRVVEVLTGTPFETAMQERIFDPLGLDHTVMLPEDALLHRAAVGHVGATAAELAPTRRWMFPRAIGPAGLICASAPDVLRWARNTMISGAAGEAPALLSEASWQEMAREQARLPEGATDSDTWGLGWKRFDWSGHRVHGHDGQTIGQSAFLRILPTHDFAFVLLANGGNARDLYEQLCREVFDELCGVVMPDALPDGDEPTAAPIHVGVYERAGQQLEVLDRDGVLVLRQTESWPLDRRESAPPVETVMRQLSQNRFVVRRAGTLTNMPVLFTSFEGRRVLHHGHRAFLRVPSL